MKMVITGESLLDSAGACEAIEKLTGRVKQMRLVHALERLAVAAAGCALVDSGLDFQGGASDIGIYIGIDDAIEDIKDEYFNGVLADGLLGASPLLFPFTSPNTLAAQISIAFDLRGEGIVMPVKSSCSDVIEYAVGCIAGGYAEKAITGAITVRDPRLSTDEGRYLAEFFIVEKNAAAVKREAGIYRSFKAGNSEKV
jgi:3-oxoacyl-(acyl-carrier-protein) synthase